MFSSRTNWHLENNRLTQALEEHRRSGRELLDLTASNPTTCGFTYPQSEILAALADPRALVYRPESKGLPEARQAIAAYYAGCRPFSKAAPPVDPERIILTSGTSEAYSHIFRLLCEPGDEILAPEPSYPLFEFLADLADIRLVPYPLLYDHGWQIDFTSLRAALTPRSRAVLVVHPNNPTGSLVQPRDAAELMEICAARDMAVIADEVFLDYAAGAAPSFVSCDQALTFTLSGISKISLLPQMKLAWTVRERPGQRREGGSRSPGNHCRHVSLAEHPGPTRAARIALPAAYPAGAGAQSHRRQPLRAGRMLRETKTVTRLERESGWYAILKVPVTATDEELTVATPHAPLRARPPRPLLQFCAGRFSGAEPDHAGSGIQGRSAQAAGIFCRWIDGRIAGHATHEPAGCRCHENRLQCCWEI